MKKNIITIGRQFGSGGHAIGEALAKKLDIPLYDEEILRMAVEKLGIDFEEAKDVEEEFVHNFILENLRLTTWEKAYHVESINRPMSEKLYKVQSTIIKELASQGPCVIVGRCADYVLRDREDVLKVFIFADDEYRINRLMDVRGMTEAEAETQIYDVDRKRAAYYEKYTNQPWGAVETQHAMLNSGALGLDVVVNVLVDMVK